MRLIFLLLAIGLGCSGQNYSLNSRTFNNGVDSPMNGVPGDLFMNTLTFTNKSPQAVSVFFNRIENNLPPYWKLCYCYIQCHSPEDDTVTVTIDPFSSTDISLQFKTDSVNPGFATASFKLVELGSNFTQTVNMQASTMGMAGLNELDRGSQVLVYPNPVEDILNFTSAEPMTRIYIYDISGALVYLSPVISTKDFKVGTEGLNPGFYSVELRKDKGTYALRFIKSE